LETVNLMDRVAEFGHKFNKRTEVQKNMSILHVKGCLKVLFR